MKPHPHPRIRLHTRRLRHRNPRLPLAPYRRKRSRSFPSNQRLQITSATRRQTRTRIQIPRTMYGRSRLLPLRTRQPLNLEHPKQKGRLKNREGFQTTFAQKTDKPQGRLKIPPNRFSDDPTANQTERTKHGNPMVSRPHEQSKKSHRRTHQKRRHGD